MKRFLRHLLALLSVHVAGLAVLTLFRVAEWAAARECVLPEFRGRADLVATSLLRGVWFDNVIACYILLLPLVAVLAEALAVTLRPTRRRADGASGGTAWRRLPLAVRLGVGWQQALFALAFLIAAANIPYYLYFSKNINSSVFEWFEYGGTTLGLVLGEPAYYPPLLGFVAVVAAFVWATRRVAGAVGGGGRAGGARVDCAGRPTAAEPAASPAVTSPAVRSKTAAGILLMGAAAVGLTLFGIRGRMGYNPIKVSQAYHCRDPFLNQLGVSPAFSLLTSAMDDRRKENRRLHLMDDAEAREAFRSLMGRDVAYAIEADTAAEASVWHALTGRPRPGGRRLNVVVILMESMSAELMGGTFPDAMTAPDGRSLTPFLDSLAAAGILFDSHYSAGIHTNHGLHATLYSMPALMKRNLMKGSDIPQREGLPTALRREGYRTMFFMTHESQYDNMNAYFRTNGYDEIYAEEDYPADSVVNAFGVPDGFLLRYALGVLHEAAQGEQPFFATLLTISNHPPYVVPDGRAYRSAEKEWQIVEYADQELRRFFEAARREPWFDHTLFVLQGDHGKRVGADGTELPRSFNHVPLILCGAGLSAQRRSQWSTQMDVQPTVLSLLGLGTAQENWGVDLWREERPCVYYTADDLIAARMRTAEARALGLVAGGPVADGDAKAVVASDAASAAAEWLYLYDPAQGEEWLHGGDATSTDAEREAVRAWLHRYVCAMLQTAQDVLDPQHPAAAKH